MTKEERAELLKEAKEMGMKSITIDNIKYEFGDLKPVKDMTVPTEEEAKEIVKNLTKNPLSDLTDDEILYWATPYYDEIQERKQKIEQQSKDKESFNG